MKRLLFFLLIPCLWFLSSCEDAGIGVEINFNDPQEIPTINAFFADVEDMGAMDLVEHFGEAYLYFGNTPPDLNDISFLVDGMDYVYTERYRFDPLAEDPLNGPYLTINTPPPTYDASKDYHHFYNHYESLSSHKIKTIDPQFPDDVVRVNACNIIGHDSLFTAYYKETLTNEGSGYPTNAIIFSGIVKYDDQGKFIGIKNFRYGKKILKYKELPSNYAPGTILIKTHEELCGQVNWDTITDKNRQLLVP